MSHVISCEGFEKRGRGWFHAINPRCATLRFLPRANGGPAIAVKYDPVTGDRRVKLTNVEFPGDEPDEPNVPCTIFGHTFDYDFQRMNPATDGGMLYQAHVPSARQMVHMLHGTRPTADDDNDEAEGIDDSDDFCVETRFDLDAHGGRFGWHPGDVTGFPSWIQATGIYVAPADCSGAGGVQITTDLPRLRLAEIHQLRINGIWLIGWPHVDREGNRSMLFSALPYDLAEIRGYGDGLTDLTMENEVQPPRTGPAVRAVCIHMRDMGMSVDDIPYAEWRADVVNLGGRVHGAAMAWGRVKYHTRRADECADRAAHYHGVLNRRFKRRSAAFADYTLDKWVDEVGGQARIWRAHLGTLAEAERGERNRAAHYSARYDALVDDHAAILDRCEEREAKFAESIAFMARQ